MEFSRESSRNQIKLTEEQIKNKVWVRLLGVDSNKQPILNPHFDAAILAQIQQQDSKLNKEARQETLKQAYQNALEGKRTIYYNPDPNKPIIKQPETKEDYAKQTKEINEIYRRLTYIQDPAKRFELARQYYARNKHEGPWLPSKQARINSLKKQFEKAQVTPALTDTGVTEDELIDELGKNRCAKGKNKSTFNAIMSVTFELTHIARKGKGYIYISQESLAKRLGFVRETISRAIDYLEEHKIIKRIKAHRCPNIYQISFLLLSKKILQLLAAFSVGRFYFQLRDVTQKVKIMIKDTAINILEVGNFPKREELKDVNEEISQKEAEQNKLCIPVVCL